MGSSLVVKCQEHKYQHNHRTFLEEQLMMIKNRTRKNRVVIDKKRVTNEQVIPSINTSSKHVKSQWSGSVPQIRTSQTKLVNS